jgi:hypothetical protein
MGRRKFIDETDNDAWLASLRQTGERGATEKAVAA